VFYCRSKIYQWADSRLKKISGLLVIRRCWDRRTTDFAAIVKSSAAQQLHMDRAPIVAGEGARGCEDRESQHKGREGTSEHLSTEEIA
jgi:hypothetical protein